MRNGLPQSWKLTTLGDLLDFKYGKGLTQENRISKGSVKVYGSNGVVGMHDKSVTKGPTIIVGRKGSVGEIHFSPEKCWPIDTTYFIDEFPVGSPPRYWELYLKSLQLGQQEKSSAIPGISRQDIDIIEVSVPSLPEQKQILAKLEKILDRVDSCQKRLSNIPVILKRFRQSVLAAACSGRLTADLNKNDSHNGLPTGWNWTRLEELFPKGGIFDGPFGSNLKTSDYTDSGVRVIRLENVGHLRFIGEKETYINKEKYEALKRHTVVEDDIIFGSFIGENIRVCILPKLPTSAIAKADCFCLRPDIRQVDREYLTYQLVCQNSYATLFGQIHGATRPRINTTQLRNLKIRICSMKEQQEIVRRVKALFMSADKIEARYAKAQGQVNKLMQSLLAKAFRGELVTSSDRNSYAR